MPLKEYQKFPKQNLGWTFNLALGRQTAYLGEDHLLVVQDVMFSEEYHRYYFEDIAAIQVIQGRGHLYWSAFFLVLASLALGMGASLLLGARSDRILAAVLGGLALFPLLALAWNLYGGPSCEAHLWLDGAWVPLPAFDRWKKFRAAWALLEPRLNQAQAGLHQRNAEGEAVAAAPLNAAPQAPLQKEKPSLVATRISLYVAGLFAVISNAYDTLVYLGIRNAFWSHCLTYIAWTSLAIALVFALRAPKKAIWPLIGGVIAAVLQLCMSYTALFEQGFAKLGKPIGPQSDLAALIQLPITGGLFIASLALATLFGLWQMVIARELGQER